MKALSCQSDSLSLRAILHGNNLQACTNHPMWHVLGFWSLSTAHCFQMTVQQIKGILSHMCTILTDAVHNPWHVSTRVSLFQHRTSCWAIGRWSGIPVFTAGVNTLSFSCLMLCLSGWWLFQTLLNVVWGQRWQIWCWPFFFFVDRTTMSVYKCSIQQCATTAPHKGISSGFT